MNRNNNDRKENNQQDMQQNETLKDPGAQVADYGRSGQGEERLKSSGSEKQEPMPMRDEDTLGNP